jgi:hypothetical protein
MEYRLSKKFILQKTKNFYSVLLGVMLIPLAICLFLPEPSSVIFRLSIFAIVALILFTIATSEFYKTVQQLRKVNYTISEKELNLKLYNNENVILQPDDIFKLKIITHKDEACECWIITESMELRIYGVEKINEFINELKSFMGKSGAGTDK